MQPSLEHCTGRCKAGERVLMKPVVGGTHRLGAIVTTALWLFSAQVWAQNLYWEPLKQWTKPEEERSAWYSGTQGSRLIPKAWLDALEQPGQAIPFLDHNYIESFGYISRGPGQ